MLHHHPVGTLAQMDRLQGVDYGGAGVNTMTDHQGKECVAYHTAQVKQICSQG